MAKVKVGDVVTLNELTLTTEGFYKGLEVTVQAVDDGGIFPIKIKNSDGIIGYCAEEHLTSKTMELAEEMDRIRYGTLPGNVATAAIVGTILLHDRCGGPDELTDFREGDLVEIVTMDERVSERIGIGEGDYAVCLSAAGGGYGILTEGHNAFAAKCKLALSEADNPVDESKIPND